jgi:glycosyltransferase involved in cell wall biosynthesis
VRLAIVHDWLNQLGGAEDVLEVLVGLYPGAPVYTSIFWRQKMPSAYLAWDIRTTWLDHAPGIHQHHRPYLPVYPIAFASLDLSGYEVVLSNKSGFCHGVRTGLATHVCYCLAPTRYIWEFEAYTEREPLPPGVKLALRPMIGLMRRWDYRAAQQVTQFVAISQAVRDRIRRFYNRDSIVIHPPVDTDLFATESRDGRDLNRDDTYYLIVSRLVAYRALDEAIEAFNRLGHRLLIAGEGPDRPRLEAMAAPNVTLLGRVPDRDLARLLAGCAAYILPGEEDFGIAPVQAQAAGRPVIAYAGGGALDTVVDGVTGMHFKERGSDALAEAVLRFDPSQFDPDACRENAARFRTEVFRENITKCVMSVISRKGRPRRNVATTQLKSASQGEHEPWN